MRTKCSLPIIALLLGAPILVGYSEETPKAEQEHAICMTNGTIDIKSARNLRDLIRDQKSTSEHLILLRRNLDESVSRCSLAVNAAYATFLAGSYINIGEKLSSLRNYEEAIISFSNADSLFVKFPHPDVLRLQALRGKALAELSLGNSADAEHTSFRQTTFAREWVKRESFIPRELYYALSFQADLCEKTGNTACAQSSRKEAKELDLSAHR